MKAKIELTDTFGGEANYCWVKRTEVNSTNKTVIMQSVRDLTGWSYHNVTDFGDMLEIRPSKASSICQVCFVTFDDSETPDYWAKIKTDKETATVECVIDQLDWQKRGLSYTATGYGSKIPTQYKINWHDRWYRVYCRVYSNIGSLYIISKGERIIVDIDKV